MLDLIQVAYDMAEGLPYTLPVGFKIQHIIRMDTKVPWLLGKDKMSIWGFTAWKDDQQYVVFRGTKDFPEWVADFISLPLTPHAHFGFHTVYESTRSSYVATKDAIITGHSLGGAIASLCFADGGGQLMTFGGPRVGDALFARTLEGTIRVINNHDIVPNLPLPPFFHHGGTEVQVSGPGSSLDHLLAHHIASYRVGVLSRKD